MTNSLAIPFVCPVAGISNYQSEAMLVTPESHLLIEREPDNPYDDNACVITVKGRKVGYVPKDLAARLILDGNDQWAARIAEILDGELRGLRIRVIAGRVKPGPEDEVEAVKDDGREREVRSKAGRLLGILVEEKGDTIVVRSVKDVLIDYPRALVMIAE